MKIEKPKTNSPRVRSAWLKKRRWPFHLAVIHPHGNWRISAGIYDTFGESATFEEAVDDAIAREKARKRGFCMITPPVVTQIPEAKARQMMRAIKTMEKVLTDGCYTVCCR